MTVWSLGTLLYVLLLGDIPYETTDHIIHNKPKKVLFDSYWRRNKIPELAYHPTETKSNKISIMGTSPSVISGNKIRLKIWLN